MIENNTTTPERDRNEKQSSSDAPRYETPTIGTYTGSELEQVILTVNAATGQVFP
jgi:hypothetical protein